MTSEFLADLPINAALIGSEMRILGDRVDDDRLQCRGSHLRDVKAANLAATLNERHNGLLWWRSLKRAVLGLAAGKGLVSFNELAFAAQLFRIDFAHCLADAVR